MDSNKEEAVSKRSQAYILIKHGYSVRDTTHLMGKLRFFLCPEMIKTWREWDI